MLYMVKLTRLPPKEISFVQDRRHVMLIETPLFPGKALAGNKCFWGIYRAKRCRKYNAL